MVVDWFVWCFLCCESSAMVVLLAFGFKLGGETNLNDINFVD